MLERSATLQSRIQQLRPYAAAAKAHAARGWAWTKRWSAWAWATAKVLARRAFILFKRALVATLGVIERTLLSERGRERVHATAVFTLIFAFGVTSVDYLLTGGPELSQGARAAPYTAQASLISARSPRPAADLAFAAPVQTTVDEGVIEDATVTPLSARAPAQASELADAAEPPKPEVERTEAPASERTKVKDEA
ncbi:hypothetical protein [Terricaulis silvestris]|uniref:Uncharacterized protein n=1 Tax=Terricaulis silvestris TaxID=2686094 RepID=A0A6I6MM17_9CAUL|nr:hypothetical protein [Terricaulis silvestris]QGZ95719.1 hypothetical protein DSM104635_02570 [Terricaulis silvestris]